MFEVSRSIRCIQRRDHRLLSAIGPQRQIAETPRRHNRRVEHVRLGQAGYAAPGARYVDNQRSAEWLPLPT